MAAAAAPMTGDSQTRRFVGHVIQLSPAVDRGAALCRRIVRESRGAMPALRWPYVDVDVRSAMNIALRKLCLSIRLDVGLAPARANILPTRDAQSRNERRAHDPPAVDSGDACTLHAV